jgi:hypothetical protein
MMNCPMAFTQWHQGVGNPVQASRPSLPKVSIPKSKLSSGGAEELGQQTHSGGGPSQQGTHATQQGNFA